MEKEFENFEETNRSFEQSFDVKEDAPYLIVRLDGKGFSKFTKENYAKPFDYNFLEQMIKTTKYLMSNSGYDVIAAYTQSDEISLVIKGGEKLPYQGKTRKLLSILAGMASAVFTKESGHLAVFDARYRTANTLEEIVDYVNWRSSDSIRNCLNNYCYWGLLKCGYSVKETNRMLKGISAEERKKILFEKVHKNWEEIPKVEKNGALFNYGINRTTGHNPITNEDVPTVRKVINKTVDREYFEVILTTAYKNAEKE